MAMEGARPESRVSTDQHERRWAEVGALHIKLAKLIMQNLDKTVALAYVRSTCYDFEFVP